MKKTVLLRTVSLLLALYMIIGIGTPAAALLVAVTRVEPLALTYAGDGYAVSVQYTSESGIPVRAYLDAAEITRADEAWKRYKTAAEMKLGRPLSVVRLFDISIFSETGEKIEPDKAVRVKIECGEAEENLTVLHFPEGPHGAPEDPVVPEDQLGLSLSEKLLSGRHDLGGTDFAAELAGNGLYGEGGLAEDNFEPSLRGWDGTEPEEVPGEEGSDEAMTVPEPVEMESYFADGAIWFETDGFSVYAVVGEGEEEDESRAVVNFFGKDTSTPLATVYVKNSDTAEEIMEIVYDPGCGDLDNKELFDGWVISTINTTDGSSYTVDTEGRTIKDIRDYLEELDIQEGDVVNIYAKIVKTITISYLGETPNVILGSAIEKVIGDDSAEYVISMNYTPETAEQAFMGWIVANGDSNIESAVYDGEAVDAPYPNGTKLTLKGDVTLSVNAPYGHWLVFDENGKGATYNAPQFVEDGDVTKAPSGEMTRLGYAFGGWYKDKNCTDGNEFTFGGELEENTTIYAKWTEAPTANYTVIVWKERMTDTYAENGGTGEGKKKNYDFGQSFTLVGNVGAIANSVSNANSSVVDGDANGTRYYNARIHGSNGSGNVDSTIAYTGYHCAGYDTGVEITPEGNTVINVYYDRNTVTYTFYTYGQNTSTGGTWWLCKEDGTQIIRDGATASSSTEIATRSGDKYSQYTGRVAHDDGRIYYYSTTGTCGGTAMREAH